MDTVIGVLLVALAIGAVTAVRAVQMVRKGVQGVERDLYRNSLWSTAGGVLLLGVIGIGISPIPLPVGLQYGGLTLAATCFVVSGMNARRIAAASRLRRLSPGEEPLTPVDRVELLEQRRAFYEATPRSIRSLLVGGKLIVAGTAAAVFLQGANIGFGLVAVASAIWAGVDVIAERRKRKVRERIDRDVESLLSGAASSQRLNATAESEGLPVEPISHADR